MTPAEELVAHLKHFEGFVGHPYLCAAGKLTLGYGHRIQEAERRNISEQEGAALLLTDIAQYTMGAVHLSPLLVSAAPRRLNAIIDFCFNAGPIAYAGSHLRLAVNAGEWAEAARQNDLWVYVTDPKTGVKNKSKWQVARRAVTSLWLATG